MCGLVIRFRENGNTAQTQNALIAMLEDVFREEECESKKKCFVEKYDMKMTIELKEGIENMCNLSDLIEERGIRKGIEQGIEQGIICFVETLQELGHADAFIAQKLMGKFSLTEEQAKKYIGKE